jgi:hypothetical protein
LVLGFQFIRDSTYPAPPIHLRDRCDEKRTEAVPEKIDRNDERAQFRTGDLEILDQLPNTRGEH